MILPLASTSVMPPTRIYLLEAHAAIAEVKRWLFVGSGCEIVHFVSVADLFERLHRLPLSREVVMVLDLEGEKDEHLLLEAIERRWEAMGITPAPVVVTTNLPELQQTMSALGYRSLLNPFHLRDLWTAAQDTRRRMARHGVTLDQGDAPFLVSACGAPSLPQEPPGSPAREP